MASARWSSPTGCSQLTSWPSGSVGSSTVRITSTYPFPKMLPDRALETCLLPWYWRIRLPLEMREFQDYTKASHAARWRRLLLSLSAGLLAAALMIGIGMRAGAVPTPMETLGYGAQGDSGADTHDGGRPGWLRGLLGGLQEVPDGPLNVLVLGVDERPGSEVEGSRTDTIMLVQVVPETGEVKLLSVPRDLLVEIEPGVEDRINAAYSYGGIEQTMGALQNYTRIPVERYVIVDFEGFRHVINAMGGVDVDVEDEIPPKYEI